MIILLRGVFLKKLNLGSGRKKLDGYINIDINSNSSPNIVRDIEKGLPFGDSSVDEVFSEHFLEHISDIDFVMFEIWRVLKTGCLVKTIVPINKGLFNSPYHKTFFCEKSWLFFTSWNIKEDSGYDFKFISSKVVGSGFEEELHFTLEVVK